MLGLERLGKTMTGNGCRAELSPKDYREPLKVACDGDPDMWGI